jgi:hypothetical protein
MFLLSTKRLARVQSLGFLSQRHLVATISVGPPISGVGEFSDFELFFALFFGLLLFVPFICVAVFSSSS